MCVCACVCLLAMKLIDLLEVTKYNALLSSQSQWDSLLGFHFIIITLAVDKEHHITRVEL